MAEAPFPKPNFFTPDEGHHITAVNNRPHAISIRCPHCRELGSFEVVAGNNHGAFYQKKLPNYPNPIGLAATLRSCPNIKCKGIVLVIDHNGSVVEVEPPQLLDFSLDNLPDECQETLKEAISCHAAGAYRAAAMMVRRLLEEICKDNKAEGKDLHQKLEALKTSLLLPHALIDAMGELKALGNDAAHIEARAYDNIGREEAEDSIELAKEILKALYQLKALTERLQKRKMQQG